MRLNADFWIDKLKLQSHPEGGYYKEIYRSDENIPGSGLPSRFSGNRSISTSIYFLLKKGQKSVFHRIKSDEIWHFYDGEQITIYVIKDSGELQILKLGIDPQNGVFPQVTVPANCWFAAIPNGEFTLVGCTVSPGFSFEDFEMASKELLKKQFPELKSIIDMF